MYTTVSYGDADAAAAKAFVEKVPALLVLEAGSRFTEIDPASRRCRTSPC